MNMILKIAVHIRISLWCNEAHCKHFLWNEWDESFSIFNGMMNTKCTYKLCLSLSVIFNGMNCTELLFVFISHVK